MTNLERLKQTLASKNIDSMLVSDIPSVQWATNFTGSNGQILLHEGNGTFVTDSRYTLQAGEQVKPLPVAAYNGTMNAAEFLAGEARKLGMKKVGFESGSVSYQTYADWKDKFGEIELVPVKNLVGPLRAVKSPEEVEKIRVACALADQCVEHVTRLIQPGVSEFDIGLEIEFFFRRHRAEIGFDPIVASGPRSALPHGRASERKLEAGDLITLDLGCKLDGYCSDITRTFGVVELDEKSRSLYDLVLKAQIASIEAIKPGVSGKAVDQVARDIFAEANMAQYFGHGLGHGLGKLVHDSGSLSPRSDTIIEPGMVLTVEPGLYLEGFGGVRIENDVVVTESGCEILDHYPKELLIFP